MKILQICHKIPFPPIDGGAQVIYSAAKGLIHSGIDSTILALNTPKNPVDLNLIPVAFKTATNFRSVNVDTRINLIDVLLNLFDSRSYFVQRFYSSDFENKLITLLIAEKFEIIQLEHLYMCIYVDAIRKYSEAKIVLRAQNIEHEIWEHYVKNCKNILKRAFINIATNRLKNFEKMIIRKLDGVIAISKEDAGTFKSFKAVVPVTNIPMGFDFTSLKDYSSEKQFENFPVIYHLGSMDWLPNVEAIEWFLKNIFKKLVSAYPDIRIYIAGKKMPHWIKKKSDKNLIVNDEVIEPIKYQEDKAIMVVPLLSGSGIRAKIVEGMSLGKTIISTTRGARGLIYKNRENILIADTANEFIDAISCCINSVDLCRRIGSHARKIAFENYEYKKCALKMVEFYKELLCEK